MMIHTWREKARAMKREVYALVLACRDPRTPWAARIVAACVVAYAFSPIDLIPDFVPVLGYLDDLILIPLGILLALRLVPPDVMADSRAHADEVLASGKPVSRAAAAVIIGIWVLLAAGLVVVALRMASR
jgi:uncharacterized membrane protein YkvA (DUF1232 family)